MRPSGSQSEDWRMLMAHNARFSCIYIFLTFLVVYPYGVFPVPGERAGNASHFRLDHVTPNALAARNNEA